MKGKVKKDPIKQLPKPSGLLGRAGGFPVSDRDDEADILIGTFEDRYAILVGLGVIGTAL